MSVGSIGGVGAGLVSINKPFTPTININENPSGKTTAELIVKGNIPKDKIAALLKNLNVKEIPAEKLFTTSSDNQKSAIAGYVHNTVRPEVDRALEKLNILEKRSVYELV